MLEAHPIQSTSRDTLVANVAPQSGHASVFIGALQTDSAVAVFLWVWH